MAYRPGAYENAKAVDVDKAFGDHTTRSRRLYRPIQLCQMIPDSLRTSRDASTS